MQFTALINMVAIGKGKKREGDGLHYDDNTGQYYDDSAGQYHKTADEQGDFMLLWFLLPLSGINVTTDLIIIQTTHA